MSVGLIYVLVQLRASVSFFIFRIQGDAFQSFNTYCSFMIDHLFV